MKQQLPEGFVTAPDKRPWHINEQTFLALKDKHWEEFMATGGVVLYHKPTSAGSMLGGVDIRPLQGSVLTEFTDPMGEQYKQVDVFLPGDALETCFDFDRRYEDIRRKDAGSHQAPADTSG